jgi:tetratricopeptide (TPR) repeat protein
MIACVLKLRQKRAMNEVPQTGRQPFPATDTQIRQELRKHHPQDNVDYFATDPNPEIRTLGRLALRRDDVNDQFALGDLCARRALTDDQRLLVFYVAKTLIGYRRAMQYSLNDVDRMLAHRAVNAFASWVVETALELPSRRNLAVALWTIAETESSALLRLVDKPAVWMNDSVMNRLLDAYRQQEPDPNIGRRIPLPTTPDETGTIADGSVVALVSQTAATIADFGADEAAILSMEMEVEAPVIRETIADETIADSFISSEPEPSRSTQAQNRVNPAAGRAPQQQFYTEPDFDLAHEFKIDDRIESRYEVADVRRGGMGIVYLCYDHDNREPVAIKSFQGKFLENDRAVARFFQEAVTWIHLEKHRHIVQARLVQNIAGRPHIILEHISGPEGLGPDLKSWIDHKRLDLAQSIEFGLHIALGMQHATKKVPGLVHRDLKPANILVTHDGIAKVTDFGLVRSLDVDDLPIVGLEAEMNGASLGSGGERLTRFGAIIGTAPYMSPEQCQSRDVDLRSDIYAFGCLLYEMVTGKPIFPARKFEAWLHAHIHETPHFDDHAMATLPTDLINLILYCVEKQPQFRPANWGVLVEALAKLYVSVTGQPPVLEVTGPALEARELMDKGYSLTELGRFAEALDAYDQAIALQPNYAWAWARKGRTLRLLNRYEEALACFNKSLEIEPNYAWAWRGKGMILERLDRWEEALLAHERAAEINPSDAWHWCNQADVLQHLKRTSEALPLLEKAVQVDPSHASSWAKLGQVHRLMKRYDQAIAAYEQAIHLEPSYAWAHNGYGLALKAVGRYKEALIAFKRAARYDTNDVWHWYNVTEMLIELRQYVDAVQPAQEATRVDPKHAPSWAKLGQVLRYVKRYEEALVAYDHAIALQPDYGWAINGKGIVMEQLGRYEDALACYQSASTSADADVWHWYNQGNVLVLLGRYEEALALLEKAVEINPTHTRSWARLGSALRHLDRYEEALNAYRKATDLDMGFAWAWNEQGITLERLGRSEEALKAYARASEAAPNDPFYIYQQADILIGMNEHRLALDLLERALRIDSSSASTWAKHGQVLRRLDRAEDSLRSFTRSVEIDPGYGWAWNGRGLTLSMLGRHEEALDSFRRAVEIAPDDVWFWYNLGDELVTVRRYNEALEALNRATRLNGRHAESWAKLGQALRRLGRYTEGLHAYDEALGINPHYAWAWNGRAQSLVSLGRREEAIASYERAIREDPHVIWYVVNFIDLLLELGRRDDAFHIIDDAVQRLPDNSTGWAQRGKVQRRLADYEGAVDSYRRALDLDMTYAWAWNGLGLALRELHRWGDARDCFRRATDYNPDDVWFWYNLGDALLRLDDPAGAVSAFRRALDIDPQHEPSQQKLILALQQLEDGE